MDPKGKTPLTENDPSSLPRPRVGLLTLLPPKIPDRLSEDTEKKWKVEKKLKIKNFSKTRNVDIPGALSNVDPAAETSRTPSDRKILWMGKLTDYNVYYGTLRIPFKHVESLYNLAEMVPPRRKTRLATVEDDEGSPWKMKVERQRNQILVDCDKFFKRNGLQVHDTVVVSCDSRFDHYINYFKCWGPSGCTSKKNEN